jgi:hypothetical protein
MWQQIKDLFRLCFGERDTIEQPPEIDPPACRALPAKSHDTQ